MLINLEKYYETECNEDSRLQGGRGIEFLTTTTYFNRVLPGGSKVLDACAGTGAYAFWLAQRGFKVTAGDVVSYNVKKMKEKQKASPVLDEIYLGDVVDLSRFSDESFDVVLCMGALYHLINEDDRKKAVSECLRVLKKDGIIVIAYCNRYSNVLGHRDLFLTDIDTLIQYAVDGKKNVFYGSTPEEIEALLADIGAKKLYNIGVDGVRGVLDMIVKSMDNETYAKYLKYHFAMCEIPSLLGYSQHGLYMGKKIIE